MGEESKAVLYRLKPAWTLPSVSIACAQVEAYLRLAKVKFAVQDCAWGSSSPTGQVPALDMANADLIGADVPDSVASELAGARAIIAHLQREPATNLDANLGAELRAEVLAFTTLLETNLLPALLHSTWCEPEAYSKFTRPALAAGLAFPLTFWLPYVAKRGVQECVGGSSVVELYEGACKTLDALAGRLAPRGPYFLGAQPTSLDALLFACLAYLRSTPVVHPELRKKFNSHRALGAYVDRVATSISATSVPSAAEADLKWTAWSRGGAGGAAQKKELNLGLDKKGRMWLVAAGAAIAGYILFSGQYIDVSYIGELGEDDDGDETE